MPLIINPPFKTSDSQLVLYVPLWAGELSGSSFNSRDIYKHLCTVTGALWIPQGRTLDGDDYITVPRAASLEPAEFTLETCVYVNAYSAAAGVLFSKDQTSHIPPYYCYHFRISNTGALHFEWNDGTTNQNLDGSSVSIGVWTHLAVTFKAGEQKVYKNLEVVLSATRTDTITYYNTNLILGTSLNLGNNYSLKGIMGEIRICNRALTALEIQRNFLATKWRYS